MMKQQQPRALYLLFFVELWERFSFYGMRGLLIYFMIHGLHMSEGDGYNVKGAYGALVYIGPLLGGFLSDKLLGNKRSIQIGAFVMMLGHLTMLIDNKMTFFVGMALVALGNGFFKPNISSTVGQLYTTDDPRKDTAFTIFYLGVNIGAFFQFLCAIMAHEFDNYHIGFSLAGFGMGIGLLAFLYYKKRLLSSVGNSPDEALLQKKSLGLGNQYWIWIGILVLVPVYTFLLQNKVVLDYMLYAVGTLFLGYLGYQIYQRPAIEGRRIIAYIILFFYYILFWAFFEQADTSLGLYIEKNLDREVWGWVIPPGAFQSVNPGYIILFALAVSSLWSYLARRNKDLSIPLKQALGVMLSGVGFLVFYLSKEAASSAGIVPLYFFLIAYIFITLGELCLSPIGLSMVTKIAPKDIASLMMGGWMLSIAFSHSLSAEIAKLTMGKNGEALEGMAALENYCGVYMQIGLFSLVAGLLLALLSRPISKMMAIGHGSEEATDRQN